MRTSYIKLLGLLTLSGAFAALLAGCGGGGALISGGIGGGGGGGGTRAYVGSKACQSCHPAQYAAEQNMGHPYKLNKVVNGVPPTYPGHVTSKTPSPPTGYSWSDITYVIGGYGWKTRFTDSKGYIITGATTQYNLENKTWSAYDKDVPAGTKPYTCGKCHTTGWVATGPDGPHQDGLEGIHGTFSEPGITCEACHGPGSVHVATRSRGDINIDGLDCAACHNRNGATAPAQVSGKFIRHHEQSEELHAGPHKNLKCVDCHDPHQGPHYATAQPGAIRRDCESCHPGKKNKHLAGPTCVDCHMPKASKSAISVNEHIGDLHTHIFNINSAPVAKDDVGGMFTADGTAVATTGGAAAVTLDFACYGCHTDPKTSSGGGRSSKTLAQLSARATGIHN